MVKHDDHDQDSFAKDSLYIWSWFDLKTRLSLARVVGSRNLWKMQSSPPKLLARLLRGCTLLTLIITY